MRKLFILIGGLAFVISALGLAAYSQTVGDAPTPDEVVDLCADEISTAHPEPDPGCLKEVHSWTAAGKPSPFAWCTWRLAEWFTFYDYVTSRMIHYGDAHVYQCRAYDDYWPIGHQYRNICLQEVEWYGWQGLSWWYPGFTGPGCPV